MRILVDLQAMQTPSRFRGIGRYASQLVKALIEIKEQNEVLILINGSIEESSRQIISQFSSILSIGNIIRFYVPDGMTFSSSANPTLKRDAELIYESLVERIKPDVLLLTSVFEGYFDEFVLPRSIGKGVKIAYIFYDLIPFKNPQKYLCIPKTQTWYKERLSRLHGYDYTYAISDFVCDEVKTLCQLNHVVSIGSGKTDFWQPVRLPSEQVSQSLEELGISDQGYVLYYGGSDERKNIVRLIEAYSLLDKNKVSSQLVICCGTISANSLKNLRNRAMALGIAPKRIIVLGFLTDEMLRLLASECLLYVFPSIEEGFGLPLLEAMSCGAPCICSGTTSLPEVLDYPSAYFDPWNVEDIKNTLEKFLFDEVAREKLKCHCIQQSKKFSWKKVATRLWNDLLDADINTSPITESMETILDDLCLRITSLRHTKSELKELSSCIEKTFFSGNRFTNRNTITSPKSLWKLPKVFSAIVDGPYDSSYSLAEVNRCFAEALRIAGNYVSLSEFALSKKPTIEELKHNNISMDLAWANHDNTDVYFRNTYPPSVQGMHGKVKAYHCYGWEETRFLPEAVLDFNKNLDIVFTVSDFVSKVLIDSGVTVPVITVGNGIDNWEKAESEQYDVDTKKFVFIHVSSCFPRKAPEVILRAYGRAFTKHDDVTLVIKTFANPHNKICDYLSRLQEENNDFPDVKIIQEDLSLEQLKYLVSHADVAILPSRGEGFGLPHAQAFISGLPLITLKWSGQVDFTSEDSTFYVNYHLAQAETHFKLKDSLWAEPDEEDLARVMKKVSLLPKKTLVDMAKKGSDSVKSNYIWGMVVNRVMDALSRIPSLLPLPEINLAWVTPWNIKCGIAEFSRYELEHFARPVTILAPNDNPLRQDESNVIRCWTRHGSLSRLRGEIDKHTFNVVVIQCHESFFDEAELDELLKDLHEKNIVTIVVFHKTKSTKYFDLSNVKNLSFADRLFVHSVEGVNDLKAVGLLENVTLRPLGIYTPFKEKEDFDLVDNLPLTIATFGFFLPHKGLREIVEAVRILKNKGGRWKELRLLMYNSAHDDPVSREEIKYVRGLVNKYNLQDAVEMHTEFLDIDDVIYGLRKAALVVYPYQDTSEGASGAVRNGLASGRPVMTSASRIFDDLASEIIKLSGYDPICIAEGIEHYFDNQDAPIYKKIRMSAHEWVINHSFDAVADHLEKVIFALHQQKWFESQGVQTRFKNNKN